MTDQDRLGGHPMHLLTEKLAHLDPVLLAAAVSLLPADLLVAVKTGVEVGYLHHDQMLGDDWAGGRHHRENPIVVSRLQRHRWPPNGDRAEWIKWGPAGAPRPAPPARRSAA